MRILKEQCAGIVIDIQERLLPHMNEPDQLVKNASILIRGLQVLEVPLMVTEQYTKGLGFTIEPIKELFPSYTSYEKIAFSCCDDQSILSNMVDLGKKYVILAGIETHVCVLQTALDLIEKGMIPVVVEDCVSSRRVNDKHIAVKRIRQAGGIVTTYESILFELTRFAGTDPFKGISKLVK